MPYGGSHGVYVTKYANTINSRGQALSVSKQWQGSLKQTNVDVNKLQQIPTNERSTAENRKRILKRRLLILFGTLLPALLLAAVIPAVVYSLTTGNGQNSTTSSNSFVPSTIVTTVTTQTTLTSSSTTSATTTSSTSVSFIYAFSNSTSTSTASSTTTTVTTTTTATTTTTTTTSTTTTAPPSNICTTNTSSALLYSNQFIYSPTHQLYAAGMLNNQFGVYNAYSYNNVTTTALWTAGQTSTPSGAVFAAQYDKNLVVYGSGGTVLWTANIFISGLMAVFCLQILDSGNLVWLNSSGTIMWQTNTTVGSG